MKKFFIAGLCLIAATTSVEAKDKYGKAFKANKATTVKSFTTTMKDQKEADDVVVKGTIAQVCQAEGCWIKLKNDAGGEDILVKFKDHAFLVPKDIAGKSVVVNGKAVKKVTSVDERKHMAEDAGASEEEIAKITTPKEELRIDATGIVVE
ncbi:MAG: DUF4920 domain-containing protein [Sphingobacteriales bacterium]|nr:MAG: DUF4920 domain-containing protein [Sphingobacteriales bacterium]